MRWIGKELDEGVALILEGMVIFRFQEEKKTRELTYRGGCNVDLAGGVGTLSYEHHNIREPAILYVPSTFSFSSFLSRVLFSLLHIFSRTFIPLVQTNYMLPSSYKKKR